MPVFYLRSTDGSDADNGSTWALAFATLSYALSQMAAGDTLYVSQNHAGSATAVTVLLSPGTVNNPCKIICVNDGAEPPTAVADTATLTLTGSNTLSFRGYAYCYGFTFTTAYHIYFGGANTTWIIENGEIAILSASARTLNIGGSDWNVALILINSDLSFSISTQTILIQYAGVFKWHGGALLNTPPATLIRISNRGGYVEVTDVDLSIQDGFIVDANVESFSSYLFERCKLHASATFIKNSFPAPGVGSAKMHSCDSANTTYRFFEEYYEGNIQQETTIVRTGGAGDGITAISYKMATNADAVDFVQPLVSPPIAIWTSSTTSKTFTIEIIHDSLTALQDDEVWVELEYPGADAQGDVANDKAMDILASPVDQASSSVAWIITGLTNPNKQKLSVTVTPGKVGPVTARVYLAKPSYTVYVDPLITES